MHFYDISPQAKLLQNLLEQFNFQYSSDEDKLTKYQKLIHDQTHKIASGLNQYKDHENNLLFLQTSFGLLFETAKNKRLSKNLDNNKSDKDKFFGKYHDPYFTTRLKILINAYLKLYGEKADLSKLKDLFKTSISGNTLELRQDFNLIFDEYTQEQKENIEEEKQKQKEDSEKTKNISLRSYFQDYFKDLSNFFEYGHELKLSDLKQILLYDYKIKNPQSTKVAEDFELEAHQLLCNYLSYVTSQSKEAPTLNKKTRELLPFIDDHRRAFENLNWNAKENLKAYHRASIRITHYQILKQNKIDLKIQLQPENVVKSLTGDSGDELLKKIQSLLFNHDQFQNPQSTKVAEDFELEAHELLCNYLSYVTSQSKEAPTLDEKTRELLPFVDEHRRAFNMMYQSHKDQLSNYTQQQKFLFLIKVYQQEIHNDLESNISISGNQREESEKLLSFRRLLFYHDQFQNPQSTKVAEDFELEAYQLLVKYFEYVTNPSDATPTLDQKIRDLLPFIDEHRRVFDRLSDNEKTQLIKQKYHFKFLYDKYFLEYHLMPKNVLELNIDQTLNNMEIFLYHAHKSHDPNSRKKYKDFELEAHELLCNYLSYVTSQSKEESALDQKTKELLPFVDEHREAFSKLDESTKQQLTSFHFTANENLLEKLLDLKNIQSQQSSIPEIFDKAQQLLEKLLILDNQINPPRETDTYKSKPDFEETAKDLLMTYLEALLSNDRSIINSPQYSKFFEKLDLDKTKLDPLKIKEITKYFLDKKQYKLSEICHGFLDRPPSQKKLRWKFLNNKIVIFRKNIQKEGQQLSKVMNLIYLFSLYETYYDEIHKKGLMIRNPAKHLSHVYSDLIKICRPFNSYIDQQTLPEEFKTLMKKQFLSLKNNLDRELEEKKRTVQNPSGSGPLKNVTANHAR